MQLIEQYPTAAAFFVFAVMLTITLVYLGIGRDPDKVGWIKHDGSPRIKRRVPVEVKLRSGETAQTRYGQGTTNHGTPIYWSYGHSPLAMQDRNDVVAYRFITN